MRGTPQQIIEKYNQLARDAQLSNDRVATENFQQHAEHYTRMLAEAQREMDARRDQQEREQQERQQRDDRQQQQPPLQGRDDQLQQSHQQRRERSDDRDRRDQRDPSQMEQPNVIDASAEADSGLVETPEEAKPKKRAPRPRKPKPPAAGQPDTPEAAE